MISYIPRYDIILIICNHMFQWLSMPEQAVISDCAWCNECMSISSLRLNPRQRQSSLWFSSMWFREILPQSGDFDQHTAAAHLGMPWCLCVLLLSDVASWMTTHTPAKSTRTLRIPPAWSLRQTSQTSLSWSPRRSLAGSVLCSREGSASRAEGPPASPDILPCWNLKPPPLLSSTTAFERTYHDACTSSRDWVTHPTNSAGGCCCGCRGVGGGEGLDSGRKFHFFVSALFTTARRCLAALRVMQARASSLACSSLITLCSDRHDLFFFWLCRRAAPAWRCGRPCQSPVVQPASFVEIDLSYHCLTVFTSLFEPRTFSSLAGAVVHWYTCTLRLLCGY